MWSTFIPNARARVRDRAADPAEADDPERRAADLVAEQVADVPARRPLALTNEPVALDEAPASREHERHRQVRGGDPERLGRVRDRDSAASAGLDVDPVVADAVVRRRAGGRAGASSSSSSTVAATTASTSTPGRGAVDGPLHADVLERVPGRPREPSRREDAHAARLSCPPRGGGSSVGRAPGCGPGGRGFESRPPPCRREAAKSASRGHQARADSVDIPTMALSAAETLERETTLPAVLKTACVAPDERTRGSTRATSRASSASSSSTSVEHSRDGRQDPARPRLPAARLPADPGGGRAREPRIVSLFDADVDESEAELLRATCASTRWSCFPLVVDESCWGLFEVYREGTERLHRRRRRPGNGDRREQRSRRAHQRRSAAHRPAALRAASKCAREDSNLRPTA